ncbi:CBS domain-containing protein [Bacillus massiliigorillae]|uniref:CBS domain-containing protein n=1 Tax=Bacillus massiliigorillae TaxID=1243664 RepID=UPI0005AB135B|nr:CBS domain-containing protein [Bacillus massiliigorillae]
MSKNLYQSFRNLYEKSITVDILAENIVMFDISLSLQEIIQEAGDKGFDQVAISKEKVVIGYINTLDVQDIYEPTLHILKPIQHYEMISANTPLSDLIEVLKEHPRLFILDKNKVTKIITVADLQKQPFTMWIFGVINILEMLLVTVIKQHYPNNEWQQYLSESRLSLAQQLYDKKVLRNEDISLLQCLQIADKMTIVTKNEGLIHELGFSSRTKLLKTFKSIQQVRNSIAHAQDLNDELEWSEIFEIISECEKLIVRLEEIL